MESFEKIQNKESEPREIKDARDWNDLYNILDKKETLTGVGIKTKYIDGKPRLIREVYSASELKDRIDKVRKGSAMLDIITPSEGLQRTVINFLVEEAESIRDLKEILLQMRGLEIGKKEKRSVGYWFERIEDIERDDLDPVHMTTEYGFRAKLMELKK